MNTTLPLSLALAFTLAGSPAWAAATDDQHEAHHPASSVSPPPAKAKKLVKPSADTARMEKQMQAMHEMHDKMMAAKTPEERNALMPEHTKLMQDGMGMMKGMSGGGMGGMKGDRAGQPPMMEKCMEMMQGMMQMMMDRLPAAGDVTEKKP
jgi:hypothetical protein